MLIVTINEIPGKKLEALGVVRGSTVQSRNFGHDIMAGFRTLVGGEVTDYAEMLTEARQIATGRMVKNAEELGADAVVGMRYASASVMQGAVNRSIAVPQEQQTSIHLTQPCQAKGKKEIECKALFFFRTHTNFTAVP